MGRGVWVSTSICANKERNGRVQSKAFLQPAKIADMCTAGHDYACLPLPIPPLLLDQKLSAKLIVLTYIMWLKLHDLYRSHWYLKG